MKDNVMFIGGFTGESKKKPGQMFYGLSFAIRNDKERENHFGWDTATVFVDDKVYKAFLTSNKVMKYVDVTLMYARGGYILTSYNL